MALYLGNKKKSGAIVFVNDRFERSAATGNPIVLNDVMEKEHTLQVNVNSKNLYSGVVFRTSYMTHENGVFTQITADTKEYFEFALQKCIGTTFVE